MKILVTAAGPGPAKDKAGYVMDFAKKLGAEVVALHITKAADQTRGEETLKIFEEAGQKAAVKVTKIVKQGDVIANILEAAEKESVNFIIMGSTPEKEAAEWISSGVMQKTQIPVVVFPCGFKGL